MTQTNIEQREICYSGRVQGVGFRYTVRSLARGRPLGGYVKNLRDGRVQLVVEGPAAEIDALLAEIRADLGRHIAGLQQQTCPASGRFDGFEIRA
jgi:acylphosphatase